MTTRNILAIPGSAYSFQDSGGTAVMTLQNLANADGRVSAQWDRGTGAKPMWYRMRCKFPLQATHTAVLGEAIEVYIVTGTGSTVDGNVGTADAQLTTDKRKNLQFVGTVLVDVVAGDAPLAATFDVKIVDRYISVAVWNGTSDHFQDDANASSIILGEVIDQLQAEA